VLHQAGDLVGAISAYERALGLDSGRLDARSNLGVALARLGRYDEAVEHYRAVLAEDPGQDGVRLNLGLALYKASRIEPAAAAFEELLARDPGHKAARLLLADCSLQLGQDARVVDLLSPHESGYGDDLLFAYLLGTALVRQDETLRGQAYIDRLFRDGETAEGLLLLGAQYLRRNDHREALPRLQKAAEMNPQLPTVHTLHGIALMDTGERPAAMAAFRRELQRNPDDFEANLRLGLLLRDENQVDLAADYVGRAARLRPKHPDVLYAEARIRLARDDVAGARERLEELTAAAPDYEGGHVLLATVYYRLQMRAEGDRQRAIVERLKAERAARSAPREPGRRARPPEERPVRRALAAVSSCSPRSRPPGGRSRSGRVRATPARAAQAPAARAARGGVRGRRAPGRRGARRQEARGGGRALPQGPRAEALLDGRPLRSRGGPLRAGPLLGGEGGVPPGDRR
jgi:tetratricopeptide (TPR) repeat protein